MSQAKAVGAELIHWLADTAPTADLHEELHLKEQVVRGLRDVVEGRTISHGELKERVTRWREPACR